MRLTIAECFAVRARSQPGQVAIEIVDDGSSYTYDDCWRRTLTLSAAIAGCEAGPHGAMAALMLSNGVDAVLAYLACQLAGVTAVPVNARLAVPEVEYVVEDSGARLILYNDAMADTAIAVSAATGAKLVNADDIATAVSALQPALGEAGRGEAASVVGYTSGTTGFPKGALWNNDHFLTAIMRWGWEFGITSDQVMLVPGPLFHLSYAGLSLAALAIGARIRIQEDFTAEAALDELCRHATFAFLVPSMTTMILEEWRARGEPEVTAFRRMISSGAPGPLSLTQEAMKMFKNAAVTEAYGWTEGGWVTFEVKHPETLLAHSVGWPTVGNEVQVFDEAGEPCGVGQAGEVGVRSLTHFSGYLGKPEESAAIWHRGYVMSGDVGIWQEDGRLCIVDRKKDMIITGGENVYTAEVERILHEHEDILEATVVGLPDPRWGEQVTAMVVARDPDLGEDAVIDFCRERLAAYKAPKRVAIVSELPRNAMGKVQKFRVVEELGGGIAETGEDLG
jgi:acyl-CoA synthetase (AMP-forming)/AMP-acid ligase II